MRLTLSQIAALSGLACTHDRGVSGEVRHAIREYFSELAPVDSSIDLQAAISAATARELIALRVACQKAKYWRRIAADLQERLRELETADQRRERSNMTGSRASTAPPVRAAAD